MSIACSNNNRVLNTLEVGMMGDRECPSCGEETLVEKGLDKWVCLNCNDIFNDVDLEGEEEME
jgi:ribosomal protein L37AE/L43A